MLVAQLTHAQAWLHQAQLLHFPNIDFLHKGYDLVKGNPSARESDPGFTYQPIVNLQYTMENNTQFNHTLPDHVGVTLAGSCTYLGSGSSDWTPDAWIQSRKSLIDMGDPSWHDPFREQVALGLNGSELLYRK